MILPGKKEIITPNENKPIQAESVEEPSENHYESSAEQKPLAPKTEPDTKPEQPKPQIKSSGGSTTSIKDALNSLKGAGETKDDDQAVDDSLTDESISAEDIDMLDVSQEELTECWNRYVEKFKTESPRIYNALSNQDPILQDDNTSLQLSFRNGALLAEFKQNFKIPLLSYLRERLNNHTLEIEEIILNMEDSSQTKYYTDIDKLKHMIEKNPSLQKLKQDFNLDFE